MTSQVSNPQYSQNTLRSVIWDENTEVAKPLAVWELHLHGNDKNETFILGAEHILAPSG